MLAYVCLGCRADYAAPPQRCPRCKSRSFCPVSDEAPTYGLSEAAPAAAAPAAPEALVHVTAPEDMDAELQAAFASAERHRLASLGLPVPDDAPKTPRDLP